MEVTCLGLLLVRIREKNIDDKKKDNSNISSSVSFDSDCWEIEN